jgi:LacI family transcriptional regulator, gluconate utilization system Gnt-I transcriptional repressor
VSRALSHPDKVKDETRQRILAAVSETGYVLNRFASSLRSGSSRIVQVFASNLVNPHFATSIQGTIDAFEGSPFHLMFAQIGYSEMLEVDVVNTALPFRPAGVIFTGVVRAEATREALSKLDIPIVEMWGHSDDPLDMLVGFSNTDGGRLMGEHFGQRGFRRIAYSGHATERGAERIAGFRDGLGKYSAELALIHPMEGTRGVTDGMGAFDDILASLPGCDAMFFGTDVLAIGALLRAQERNIAVPGQVAIAGFGGLDFTAHVKPGLTTLNIEGYEMGLTAGRMMLARLNDETVERPIFDYPITLIERQSTGR